MGFMDKGDMKTELGFLLGNRNDADAVNSDRLERWLTQAYIYVCHPGVHPFREMQGIANVQLTSGTRSYDLGSAVSETIVSVRWVVYTGSTSTDLETQDVATKKKLQPRDMRWFESRTIKSGRPSFFGLDGSTLYLSTIPGTAEDNKYLRVGYYKQPVTNSAGWATGTDHVLNAYFDRPILKFAQAFAETDLGDRAKSLITLKEAQGLMNNAQSENELEAEDTGHQTEVILHSSMGP